MKMPTLKTSAQIVVQSALYLALLLAPMLGSFSLGCREAQAGEILLNAFRGPSMGLEFKHENWGLHLGLYPTILDQNAAGQARTTWFLRSGLNYYHGLWQDPFWGEGGLYGGVSLMQGINNAWNVSESATQGSGVMGDIGVRWRFLPQLEARLGVALLVGFDGRMAVNPTPGISCVFAL